MLKLLIDYPEAASVIRQHFLSRMLEGINSDNLPDDFKEHVKSMGIDNSKIANMVGDVPRSMFDVFDNNQIFINVIFNYDDRVFTWAVNGETDNKNYVYRKAAEQDAVAEAFKLLNDKLCQIQS